MGDSKKSTKTALTHHNIPQHQLNLLRERDLARLRERFYQGFDPSMLLSFLHGHTESPRLAAGWSFIGEGYHFQSYKVLSGAALPLVLSVATSRFAAGLSSEYKVWCQAMAQLKRAGLPLVPPFEILHDTADETKIAYVTPYGDQTEGQASPHWQPLAMNVELLHDALEKLGLVLGDVAQIRCVEGIPFIIDWSDLGNASRR